MEHKSKTLAELEHIVKNFFKILYRYDQDAYFEAYPEDKPEDYVFKKDMPPEPPKPAYVPPPEPELPPLDDIDRMVLDARDKEIMRLRKLGEKESRRTVPGYPGYHGGTIDE